MLDLPIPYGSSWHWVHYPSFSYKPGAQSGNFCNQTSHLIKLNFKLYTGEKHYFQLLWKWIAMWLFFLLMNHPAYYPSLSSSHSPHYLSSERYAETLLEKLISVTHLFHLDEIIHFLVRWVLLAIWAYLHNCQHSFLALKSLLVTLF